METYYFKRPQRDGIYHYYKVHGTGDKKKRNGHQEVINFLNDTPMIFTEHDEASNGLTGTWCTFEVGEPITKEEYQEAYKRATAGEFDIR